MLTIRKKINETAPYPLNNLCSLDKILFFDIETTGFLPEVSSVYLIGCGYYENDSFQLQQWYADDYHSEEELLTSFHEFSKRFDLLIHFNGERFDIPYITKKFAEHHLELNFDHLQQLDLYKKVKPYKTILGLSNCKQKTIEQFLQITRNDQYTGGELISVYVDYMKARIYRSDEQHKLLELLLLHNEEDVIGMIQLTTILFYTDLLEGRYPCSHVACYDDCLVFQYQLPIPLPVPLQIEQDWLALELKNDQLQMMVPLAYGELKHYFSDYKDYYYLPSEDQAVHKSVAIYVDKEHRKKATAKNCYLRKTAYFLPQFTSYQTPEFKEDTNATIEFFEFTLEMAKDQEFLRAYGNYLIQYGFSTHK